MWVWDGDMPESVTDTNGAWLENHSFTSLTRLILDIVAGLLSPPLHIAPNHSHRRLSIPRTTARPHRLSFE